MKFIVELPSNWKGTRTVLVPSQLLGSSFAFPHEGELNSLFQFLYSALGFVQQGKTSFLSQFPGSSLALPQEGELSSLFQYFPSSLIATWDLFNKANPVSCSSSFPVLWEFLGPHARRWTQFLFSIPSQFLDSSLRLVQQVEPSSLF